MFELLFILLPIAAAYGYYMGRHSIGNKKQDDKHHKNISYLSGVDYLLDDDKSKAVDKFIDYLSDADPSFENSLALANLFRKRGEVDKAINLHSALLKNTNLDVSEHEISNLELARDFISAGLLDRAESILQSLVDIPRMRKDAAMLLINLYEQERDFNKAIEVALAYRDCLGSMALMRLGHYYCEVAEQELAQSEYKKAQSLFLHAIDVDENSVRARLGLAKLAIKNKNIQEAMTFITKITSISDNYALLCLDLLKSCYPNLADPNLRQAIESLVRRTKSAQAMSFYIQLIEQDPNNDADLILFSFLKENPNLKLFSSYMALQVKGDDSKANEAILQLKSLVDAQISRNYNYACHNCGFKSKILFWQCPSCRRWDSMRTIKGLDGD